MFQQSLLALLLAGLAYASPAALAQNSTANDSQASSAPAPDREGPGHHRMDPQQRSQMLAEKLNLSSDQQSKVKDILQSSQSDMEKVHADSSLAQADRRAKMMDIHKSTNDQIRGLLNPDQQKKFDKMQARQEERMERRHHGEPPASTPPVPDQKQ